MYSTEPIENSNTIPFHLVKENIWWTISLNNTRLYLLTKQIIGLARLLLFIFKTEQFLIHLHNWNYLFYFTNPRYPSYILVPGEHLIFILFLYCVHIHSCYRKLTKVDFGSKNDWFTSFWAKQEFFSKKDLHHFFVFIET